MGRDIEGVSTRAAVSHADFSAHCAAVGQHLGTTDIHVQVQQKGVVSCGRVVTMERFADAREAEWFKVKVGAATGWFPARQVRLCSQVDGRCTCTADEDCAF